MAITNHIKFGDGLEVTDEGGGVIRVDAGGGGGGGTATLIVGQGTYQATVASLAPGSHADAGWVFQDGDELLLLIDDNELPSFIAGGIYAIGVTISVVTE